MNNTWLGKGEALHCVNKIKFEKEKQNAPLIESHRRDCVMPTKRVYSDCTSVCNGDDLFDKTYPYLFWHSYLP